MNGKAPRRSSSPSLEINGIIFEIELNLKGAGIYILVGYANPDDELPTIYIGHADTINKRITQHTRKKDFWDKAVIFVSSNKINSTHARWLEFALIHRVFEANRSLVENGNSPQEPTISEAEKAEMQFFLNEIYQTLPLVGIRAFEVPKSVAEPQKANKKEYKNTIVVPAKDGGFQRVFLGENAWYAIRISGGMLEKVKYIAAYQTAPISTITHYAEVDNIEPYGEEGKYRLNFSGPATKLETIWKMICLQEPYKAPGILTLKSCYGQNECLRCFDG